MKIQNKLSLLFTFLTATILLVFAGLVYYSASNMREHEFYNRLKKEAITKANLFLSAKVSTQTLQTIYRNNRETINEVEVAIYDTAFSLLYHDAKDIDLVKETESMVQEISKKKEIRFYQEMWQVVGLAMNFNGKKYVVTATAYDHYGYQKLEHLSHTIWAIFVFSVIVIYFVGRFFSKRALMPVSGIVTKVRSIGASNLDLRLPGSAGKDEISALAGTFNEMLDRLENSFDAQKQFVSNISHELRTPLAAIIAELEISMNKERNISEYKEVIENTLDDAKKLSRLSTSLLDFAKANYDAAEISYKEIRIDEILLDAIQEIQKLNPDYHVDISFLSLLENDSDISVNGNEYLLKVAFLNLLENGCKFSTNHKSTVSIDSDAEKIILAFTDEGIGIPKEDLPHIFTPFYRGTNGKFANGNGIGLSLTKRIIVLHSGEITVRSTIGEQTSYLVSLPKHQLPANEV